MSCDACEQNLKAEIRAKDESERTEQERQVLEEGDDALPSLFGTPAYGPLSEYDGTYCEFCHGIGQVGSLMFGGLVGFAVTWEVSLGIGILAGLLIWLPLALMVGYLGRFPILGSLFGPIVEKIVVLQFGVYLTKSSREKYGTGSPVTDGGRGQQTVERRFPMEGSEMHVVASPAALERCADMDEEGALLRLEVENGQITDIHNFHPQFNQFRNIRDHVGYRRHSNVCDAKAQEDGPVTVIDFSEMLQNGPEGAYE